MSSWDSTALSDFLTTIFAVIEELMRCAAE